MRDRSRNPYTAHNGCDHESFQILWPVGTYGTMDLWMAMQKVDAYLENGDALAARQLLWDVGVTLEAPYVLTTEQLDDAVFTAQVENFVEDFEKEQDQ